jgi:hypothetical protein
VTLDAKPSLFADGVAMLELYRQDEVFEVVQIQEDIGDAGTLSAR